MIYELIVCNECDDFDRLTMCKVPLHIIIEKEIHLLKCEFSHATLVVSDSQKFENLIYLAFISYQNNFYHQAVVNMATAFENLQEFIIYAILKNNDVGFLEIENSLKKMKLSERRLGGYYYMFLNEFKIVPELPNQNKEIKFRNDVIHNGYFCSKDETLNYMFEMYRLMIETIKQIENTGFKILDLIINSTTLKSKDIKELKEVWIHDVNYHVYISTREMKSKITKEDFMKLLDAIPNYYDLVISKRKN